MSNPESYKNAFRDVVFELVQRAKDLSGDDVLGQRIAMLHTLGLIKSQAVNFGLDLKYLGLEDFDPERWFIESVRN